MSGTEHVDTVVIGGGQAGLAIAFHLARRGKDFVVLDAHPRIGDSWRRRYDSLRLFSPARLDGLPGMRFPAPGTSFPTGHEMADFLETYAAQFGDRVRTGVRVDRLSRSGEHYLVAAGGALFEADQVVVAIGPYHKPEVPELSTSLDPSIRQLHSSEYRNPSQLRGGGVLVVGAGTSGADIALEVAATHPTWLAGRDVGHVPFRIDGFVGGRILEPLLLRVVFHRLLTTASPLGRKVRPKVLSKGAPLIRVKPKHLERAGVHRVPRLESVDGGMPVLADGTRPDVTNVIWCTGYETDFSWIDRDVLGELSPGGHEPVHDRGVIEGAPGLYVTGLHFLYAMSSAMIHGADRDAAHIAAHIAARSAAHVTLTPVH